MKNLLAVSFVIIIAGCSSAKKANTAASTEKTDSRTDNKNPKFIEDITINPATASKKNAKGTPPAVVNNSPESSMGALKFKYAILLDVPVEEIDDTKLFSFIDSWYGTPYRYGGFSKEGVDCSGFTQAFMSGIYNISIPRISAEQYNQSKRISRKELEEGDLVFFKTSGRTVSHVGIYLRNNKFVHASTSAGVTINDLDDDYYARRFAGYGRVR